MNKTKKQLVDELANLRSRIAEMEAAGAVSGRARRSGLEGEAGLKALLENAPDIIFSYSLDGVFLYGNKRLQEVLGYSPEELVGKSIAESGLLTSADLLRAMAKVEENRRGLVTGPDEYNLMAKDGSIVVVEARGVPVVEGDGVVVISIARDITERKRMEHELDNYRSNLEKRVEEHTAELEREMAEHGRAKEALRASDERLRAFIDNSPDAVFVNDVQGRILHVNRKAEELCGFSRDDVIGKSVFDLGVLPSGSGTWIETLLRGIVEGRIGGPYEFELNRKDGGSVSIAAYAFPVIRDWGMDIVGIAKDITGRKKAEAALRESEGKYRNLVEQSLQGLMIIQGDRPVFVNEHLLDIAGYTGDELFSMSIEDIFGAVYPDDRDIVRMHYLSCVEGESAPQRFECRIVLKDGAIHWLDTYTSVIEYQGGTAVQTAFVDITERKRAEEALRESEGRLRAFIENAPDAIFVYDLNGVFLDGNRKGEELTGYSKDELIGKTFAESGLFSEEYARKAADGVLKDMLSEPGGPAEYEIIRKDGRRVYVEATSFVVSSNGKREVVGIARDITERKKAQKLIEKSEELLSAFMNSATDAFTIWDADFRLIDLNKAAMAYLPEGVKKEDVIGQDLNVFIPNVTESDNFHRYRDVLATGRPMTIEDVIPYSAGGDRYLNVRAFKVGDGIGIATTDITERRRTEEALRDSEEKLRVMFRSMNDGVVVSDLNINIVDVNKAALDMAGYDTEEGVVGRNALEFIKFKDREKVFADMYRMFQEPDLQERGEYWVVLPTGKELEVEVNTSAMYSDAGSPVGFINVIRDITNRKKAEQALKNSEERLRIMFESIKDAVVVTDLDVKVREVNAAALETFGYAKEDLIGHSGLDIIAPEDRERAMEKIAATVLGPNMLERQEFRLLTKDGRRLDTDISISVICDANGKAVGFLGVMRDVTARKKADEALRASEEKLRLMFESIEDGIFVVDLRGSISAVNESIMRMTGYSRQELLQGKLLDYVVPDYRDLTVQGITRAFTEGRTRGKVEFPITVAGGRTIDIEVSAASLRDEAGKPIGLIGTVRDVTERKRTDKTLRESEERYRLLAENVSDVIWTMNMNLEFTYISPSVRWMLRDYTLNDIANMKVQDLIAPQSFEKAMKLLADELALDGTRAVDAYRSQVLDMELRHKDGTTLWTEVKASFIRDQAGKPIGILGVTRDITERKKAEEKIARHARRFEALHAVAQVISQSMNLDKMLSGALAKACGAMDMESGCIFLLDLSNRALELEAHKGVSEQTVRRLSPVMLTDAGLDILLALKEPVTVLDEAIGVTDFGAIQRVVTDLGARTVAAVPFSRGMDVRGVLVLFGAQERVFTKDDLDLLTSIANEIAVGVDNIKLLERTQEMSVTDELTGLYNRRHFFAMLDAEMSRAQRSGRSFSLVMLDLDGFKEYNDKFGHTNGDTILQVLAKVLGASIRKSDLAFRYGGDEFAILVPAAGAQKALKIVERARAKWQKAPDEQSLVFESHIGFSTGIAEFPANAESADGLVFLADAALYQAKRMGGFTDKLVSDLRTLSPEILDVATQDQVYALAATVDARDPYTYGHSKRVAGIAAKIGKSMGLAEEAISKLYAAALLHDIGKVGVPDAILTKAGRPTPEEWSIIKRHCAEGARIVGYVKELASIVPVILCHHEWYDGTGYPNGLKGTDIPLGARITSVADAYDTMITQRPYRHVVAIEEACRELRRCAGAQFDPEVVEVWCKMAEEDEKGK